VRGVSELLLSREREGGSAPATIICGSLKRYVAMAEILCATSADGEERPAKRAKAELCQNCLRRGCGGECMGGRRRRLMVIASANELSAGALDSLTQTEIQQRFPREYEARKSDKFNYRCAHILPRPSPAAPRRALTTAPPQHQFGHHTAPHQHQHRRTSTVAPAPSHQHHRTRP